MKSQQLTQRIAIERPNRIADDVGGTATVYEFFLNAWAEPFYSSSSNSMDFARVEVRTAVDFVVRHQIAAQIEPNFRIVYKGKSYIITGIRTNNGEVFATINTGTSD